MTSVLRASRKSEVKMVLGVGDNKENVVFMLNNASCCIRKKKSQRFNRRKRENEDGARNDFKGKKHRVYDSRH